MQFSPASCHNDLFYFKQLVSVDMSWQQLSMTKSLHIFHSSRTRRHLEWWDAFCGSTRGGPEHWSHWSAGSWPIRDGRSSLGGELSFLPTSDGNEKQPRSHETCSCWLRFKSGHKTPGRQVMPQWECNSHVCLPHDPLTQRKGLVQPYHLIHPCIRTHAQTHTEREQVHTACTSVCTWLYLIWNHLFWKFIWLKTCDPTLVFIFLGFCNIRIFTFLNMKGEKKLHNNLSWYDAKSRADSWY
jgi:hypothetical protein